VIRVLVPVKAPTGAKQRLGKVLTLDERRGLARAMALDLLALLSAHPGAGPVIVCGSDGDTEALARAAGVEYLPEAGLGASGLSGVVNAAAAQFAAEGVTDLLVIHGDLPLLTHAELEQFLNVHRAAGPRAVTAAPDRWRGGTNLLAWRPLDAFKVEYGEGSFERHCASATRSGAQLSVCELQGGSLDIDEPADLEAATRKLAAGVAPNTLDFVTQHRIVERLQDKPGSA
jgi:2-phospho-L-lactate guanylyltransferase